MDRMAAEAPSWVVGRTAAAVAPATAWEAPVPTRSTAVGTSIDMTIAAPIDMTTVARIGTAITRPTPRMVAPAGGGLQRGACGCAATSVRTMDIGTATIARIIATATIAHTADTAAIMARPMDVAKVV